MKAMIGAGALALALGALAAGPASADMSGLVGNTIVANYSDGSVTKVHPAADGTFTIQRPGGTFHGTWKDDGQQVCYQESDPSVKAVCSPSTPRKVGDSWSVTDPNGVTVTVTIAAGSQ